MTATSTFALSTIGQIALTAGDVERAKRFYRDALGLPHLFDAPPKMTFFDCAGIRLLLGESEDGTTKSTGSTIYFQVPDIAVAHEALRARGVEFIEPPHFLTRLPQGELWMAFFRDSEGNTLALQSIKPAP
ncbi:MAG TPA: VOC family protein [Candidatus Eisenbacteria bacterium]|jgi:methylmalonyl-CoA/ethylmalonyl-CoA epimerase